MCIKNKIVALVYRSILTVLCGYGLYLHLGFPLSKKNVYVLVYYTILSNLICFIFFLILTVQTFLDIRKNGTHGCNDIYTRPKGAVTMMITVTFLVYNILLAPRVFSMGEGVGFWKISNIIVHILVPAMVIADWILFDKKNSYRWYDPVLWLLIPVVYLIFILIRGYFGEFIPHTSSRYPYFFLNIDVLGGWEVFKWVSGIAVFLLLLGYIFYFIDNMGRLYTSFKK